MMLSFFVMAGLVPAISIHLAGHCQPKRDGRDKRGHDRWEVIATNSGARREYALQGDAETQCQVRLQVVVRLVAAGGGQRPTRPAGPNSDSGALRGAR